MQVFYIVSIYHESVSENSAQYKVDGFVFSAPGMYDSESLPLLCKDKRQVNFPGLLCIRCSLSKPSADWLAKPEMVLVFKDLQSSE